MTSAPRRAALFPTCVVDALNPEVGVASVRLLRRLGIEVSVPDGATCCGQPAWNAGQTEAAARVARVTAAALAAADADVIIVPAGSCATMIRVFWQELFELAHDREATAHIRALAGRVRELSEFLDGESLPAAAPPHQTVAFHRTCHMLRELGIVDQPERLLDATGATRVRTSAEGRCCGFGGLFSVKLPETSTAMADDILDAAVSAGAAELIACDASCLMHLAGRAEHRGLPLQFRHLAEVLDEGSG